MEEAFEAQMKALNEMGLNDHKRLEPVVEKLVNQKIAEDLKIHSEPLEVPTDPKVHFQYYEPAEGTGGLPAVICTCGAKKHHLRFKVLGKWSEKHFAKTGHNTKPPKG